MNKKSVWTRAGVSVAAVTVMVGVAGCQDGATKAADEPAAQSPVSAKQSPMEAVQAAYKKTAAAKSAKVRMTMSLPADSKAGGGTMEISGVQGWDPAVMDITVKGSMFKELAAAGGGEVPEAIRMMVANNVMYMDMGTANAAQLDGKRWMKLDLNAAAQAGGAGAADLGGMSSMNQDPAQQIALLLDSKNLKHVGTEQVEGVSAEHYQGTLSFEEMLAANESSKVLSEADRKALVENVGKTGLKGYDTDLWVNKDGYPARMSVSMEMAGGTMDLDAYYSDYGSAASVQTPADSETFDLFAMLKEMGGAGAGA
ncbi:hypothetical protein [Streptomyces sp. NBC_01244]|uniref:hypothetical protein n=1 Tax=Streptomyces sp. NBC_01244 TaxID=2903797 RepID=UPI002E0F1A14|nr:hypothetical protein OG247_25785 [Streptomyces sp. NBC_01244]